MCVCVCVCVCERERGREGGRERERQRIILTKYYYIVHTILDGHKFEQAPELVMDREPGMLQSVGSQRVRHG